MEEYLLTTDKIKAFSEQLELEEKSPTTIEKYIRDVNAFRRFCGDHAITKETVLNYKQQLLKEYAIRSINSMLASLNGFFSFLGWRDLRVKSLKIQQEIFCPEEKELTRAEYVRLCRTAERAQNQRISLILQTICSTGIRVSELPFVTVEAVCSRKAVVSLKGKTRTVFLTNDLQKKLLRYIRAHGIVSGAVFITRSGKPMNRTNIWREMKQLCKDAGVDERKVFPHNLRHLFARIFYGMEKDIVKLADILGHSSINTTRIYIVSSGTEHLNRLERMHLVL